MYWHFHQLFGHKKSEAQQGFILIILKYEKNTLILLLWFYYPLLFSSCRLGWLISRCTLKMVDTAVRVQRGESISKQIRSPVCNTVIYSMERKSYQVLLCSECYMFKSCWSWETDAFRCSCLVCKSECFFLIGLDFKSLAKVKF